MMQGRKLVLVLGLVAIAWGVRLCPYLITTLSQPDATPGLSYYPWNFSPLMAICLFSGSVFRDRRWGYALPLFILIMSDLSIGIAMQNWEMAVCPLTPITYACQLGAVWLGRTLLQQRTLPRLVGAAVIAELVFFLVTNGAHWGFMPTRDQDLLGLFLTYQDGIPFLRNSLLGTALFSTVLFGGLAAYELANPRQKVASQTA